MINFKGPGEHSITELEQICKEQQEALRDKQLHIQELSSKIIDYSSALTSIQETINQTLWT